jgi:DNA-binding CsgD family transcriptional regulator
VATLVGRESELQELLAALAPGSACRVVLTAPPGMGKTTLIEACLGAVAELDLTVSMTRPTEVDQRLAFSGLTDLLTAVHESAYDVLPDPQRRAIRAALLLDDPEADVDPRAVAAAVRTVWSTQAESRPVLVVLDDTQWLDQATATVLSHTLRRLGDAPVQVVAAGRPVEWPLVLDDAMALELPPLGPAALFHVVKEHLGLALDRARLLAVEQASGGNPLYALELVRHQLGGGSARTLDELIGARVRELPGPTRRLLLTAALAASPTVDVLATAAGCTPQTVLAQLEPARTTGLVRVSDIVAFAHPLYAEAVVDEAADLEVRDAHAQLAATETDEEARVRHLGAAAAGPDADLADRLDDAATSARHRGAWGSAVGLLRLAVELTPEQDDRVLRRVRLGEWLTTAGRSAEAEEEFAAVRETATGPAYWRATIGLGRLWVMGGREAEAVAILSDVVDTDAAQVLQAEALFVIGDAESGKDTHVARAVSILEELPRSTSVDGLLAAALVTLSWLRAEKGEPFAELLARAAELQRGSPPERATDSAEFVLGQQALFSDLYDEGRAIFSRLVRHCEESGEDYSLPSLLSGLAHLEYLAGRWDDAERILLEARRLSEGQRQVYWQLTGAQQMLQTGLRGDRERALAEIESLRAGELTTADPAFLAIVESSAGRVELAHGDALAAFGLLARAVDLAESVDWTDPGQTNLDITYFDAAIGSGHLDEAESRLAVVEERAERLQRSAVLLGCRRARLALAVARGDVDQVVEEIPDLLAAYDAGPCEPMERAHAYVFAGKVYRRARKKRMSHDALTHALAVYEQIGCPPFAEQARAELARVGLRPGAPDELTETERRVARLAADGLRNKEIADQLFMSAKTVEANLSRAYRKLDVRARTDLAKALAD